MHVSCSGGEVGINVQSAMILQITDRLRLYALCRFLYVILLQDLEGVFGQSVPISRLKTHGNCIPRRSRSRVAVEKLEN